MGALDLRLDSTAAQHGQAKLVMEGNAQGSVLSDGNCTPKKIDGSNPDDFERLEKGIMQYGCAHYRRRCRIRAPCCNEIFDCRHCHNEAKELNSIRTDTMKRHELPRHEVQQVICSLCGTEQEVRQVCINCGVCMGKYFCGVCKLFDDDVSKQQYHCNGCGICRIGGRENFFHCSKCGCCYSTVLKNSHPCVEGAMHHDCPICFEYLFESTNDVSVLPCGHTIHVKCLKEMEEHCQFACPLCSKSVCDMSKAWERLDMELASISDSCDDKMVRILCKGNFHSYHQSNQVVTWPLTELERRLLGTNLPSRPLRLRLPQVRRPSSTLLEQSKSGAAHQFQPRLCFAVIAKSGRSPPHRLGRPHGSGRSAAPPF
ncbi:hypothetical protein ACP70R_036874 [Stipagrostis hirtigluma subsp. patula]